MINLKQPNLEIFQVVNAWSFWKGGVPLEGMEALHPLLIPSPLHLFHLAVPELYSL